MYFFHLSHNDLDGYCCQLISQKIFPNGKYYNANYGLEVQNNLEIILDELKQLKGEDIFFLISDLNLTIDESKNLNREINHLNNEGWKIKLQLLDHHATGKKSSDKYQWYYLDTTRCATKIVFEYFSNNYEQFNQICSDNFRLLIEAVDDVDIWCENDEFFEFGKVIMRLISHSTEINSTLFPNENRKYRLKLLEQSIKYITQENGHILLDDNIHFMKKEYLKLTKENDTIDNLMSLYLVYLLKNKKDELTIYYKEHKGLLTFTISNISIPANKFLKENPDYDFFINVGRRGTIGLRADGKLDVAQLASKLANGGGHPNASGGFFDDFKETIKYSEVKKFIEGKISSIS